MIFTIGAIAKILHIHENNKTSKSLLKIYETHRNGTLFRCRVNIFGPRSRNIFGIQQF